MKINKMPKKHILIRVTIGICLLILLISGVIALANSDLLANPPRTKISFYDSASSDFKNYHLLLTADKNYGFPGGYTWTYSQIYNGNATIGLFDSTKYFDFLNIANDDTTPKIIGFELKALGFDGSIPTTQNGLDTISPVDAKFKNITAKINVKGAQYDPGYKGFLSSCITFNLPPKMLARIPVVFYKNKNSKGLIQYTYAVVMKEGNDLSCNLSGRLSGGKLDEAGIVNITGGVLQGL